jgi:hypothetical protein
LAIGVGLRQVQAALEKRAALIQREFIGLSDDLDDLNREMLEVSPDERQALRQKQAEIRQRQQELAEEINQWRTLSRQVMTQPGMESLRNFLNDLLLLDDEGVKASATTALHLLDLPPEERLLQEDDFAERSETPAGRLLERARTEYDLRSTDPGARRREAIAFANRPGIPQDENVLGEIAAAMEDPDPLVRELATLTTIQLYRFRALRMAHLEPSHEAVQFLARMSTPEVIPVLIEILENPRTGYIETESGTEELENSRSRMVALLRLVEWHTAEAQNALRKLKFDQDRHIVKAAARALELFPDPWTGPMKGQGKVGG